MPYARNTKRERPKSVVCAIHPAFGWHNIVDVATQNDFRLKISQ